MININTLFIVLEFKEQLFVHRYCVLNCDLLGKEILIL